MRATTDLFKIIERNYGDSLRGMGWSPVGKVDYLPHAVGEIRLRQNPATANATQPISLGETAGYDEVRAQMKR